MEPRTFTFTTAMWKLIDNTASAEGITTELMVVSAVLDQVMASAHRQTTQKAN